MQHTVQHIAKIRQTFDVKMLFKHISFYQTTEGPALFIETYSNTMNLSQDMCINTKLYMLQKLAYNSYMGHISSDKPVVNLHNVSGLQFHTWQIDTHCSSWSNRLIDYLGPGSPTLPVEFISVEVRHSRSKAGINVTLWDSSKEFLINSLFINSKYLNKRVSFPVMHSSFNTFKSHPLANAIDSFVIYSEDSISYRCHLTNMRQLYHREVYLQLYLEYENTVEASKHGKSDQISFTHNQIIALVTKSLVQPLNVYFAKDIEHYRYSCNTSNPFYKTYNAKTLPLRSNYYKSNRNSLLLVSHTLTCQATTPMPLLHSIDLHISLIFDNIVSTHVTSHIGTPPLNQRPYIVAYITGYKDSKEIFSGTFYLMYCKI